MWKIMETIVIAGLRAEDSVSVLPNMKHKSAAVVGSSVIEQYKY
jgi:hypothetical protein